MNDCRRELIDQQNRLAAQLNMSYRKLTHDPTL